MLLNVIDARLVTAALFVTEPPGPENTNPDPLVTPVSELKFPDPELQVDPVEAM